MNRAESPPRITRTVGEVAHLLGVSPMTVRRMIDNGQLGAIRAGRTARVPVAEVDRLIAAATPQEVGA